MIPDRIYSHIAKHSPVGVFWVIAAYLFSRNMPDPSNWGRLAGQQTQFSFWGLDFTFYALSIIFPIVLAYIFLASAEFKGVRVRRLICAFLLVQHFVAVLLAFAAEDAQSSGNPGLDAVFENLSAVVLDLKLWFGVAALTLTTVIGSIVIFRKTPASEEENVS